MRSLSTPLIQSLMEEESFKYAHLVKFEKPIKTESGKPTKTAISYSYITDASVDISYDDLSYNALGTIANGAQTYIANRLLDVSGISETIEARASNFSITIGASALNTSLSGSFTVTGSNPYVITGTKNLVEAGFLEGDEVYLTGLGWTGRINTFTASGGVQNAAASLTLVEGTGSTGSVTKITVNTKDIGAILLDKTQGSYARYINREVYVYKAHINVTTGAIIGTPFLLFKGIITSGSLTEDPTSESKMVWNISSHWGDWVRVNGRITSDSSHRALSNDGTSDRSALIRPEYADDLGFLHSEQALNIMASYKVSETRYKTKKSGLFGLKVKIKEYKVLVDREVDLRFNLEAKYLPVVYGVQRLDSIPFFVDTDKNAPNKVYAAYALCEGEIGGIFDIYFGDQSSICLDADDNAVRSSTTTTANIDVICSGRADRGDTLAGQTVIDTSTTNYADILRFNTGQLTTGVNLFAANFDRRFFNRNAGFTGGVAATIDPLGITHEKGRSFADPIDCKFVVHTGKSEQRADDILVAKAQNNEFKVQGSYYAGDKSQYWGANHRVLDTAYVTAEYILSEGEEELPSVEFIVKGKAVECYNYDYSYIHDPTKTSETAPTIGTTVTANGKSLVVADVYTDEFGYTRVRFLTDPGLSSATSSFSITTPAYTLLASNAVLISGSVPSVLQTAVSSSTFNSTTQTYNITTAAGGIGSFGGLNLPDLRYTIADALITDTSVLTNEQRNQIRIRLGGSSVPSGTSSTTVNGITNNTNVAPAYIITKNGIKLASGASTSNDAYNGFIIELIRTNTDGSIITQKRTITDYDGTNLIATVDRDWDAVYYPNTGDTYKIYAPSDKRITNNPAMQLLDYITSVRYGRGLDVNNDINLDTFKSSARKCDTRSDITVTTTTQATVGDIYTYTSTTLKFRGKVTSSTLVNGLYETTFTDVIGKLGNKWQDWKSFAIGDFIWNSGAVYQVTTAGTFTAWPPTSNATLVSTSFNLSRVGGGTIAVSITSASFDGNPIVKKYVSSSKSYISGYSLYDSDDVKYWRYVGWNEQNQRHVTRHQTNIIINTSNPVFDNINTLLGHFNGILRYNAGKYELDVEAQHSSTSGTYGYNEVSTDLNTWTVTNATKSVVSITGPTGGDSGVIQLTEAATSPNIVPHYLRSGTFSSSVLDNDVLIGSAYLKAGTYTAGGLKVLLKNNTTVEASFDLTGNGASKNISALAAGIYSVGNGWYRCWIAANVLTGGTAPKLDIAIDNTFANATVDYSSSVATNYIYASSAKVELYRSLDYTTGPTSYIYYPNIIGEEDIIGAISVEDPGNKDTFNTISVDIPDPRNRFEERSVTYFNSTYLIEDNSVPKKGDMKATGITNYFNARLNAKQYLEQSRYGLKINFTMPPKGILITAGEIIEITNARLGFVSKPFRVTNLTVNKDCLVQISADEHTNNAYSIAPSSGGVFTSSEPIKGITLAPKIPTAASATTNLSGIITLTWTNPVGFNSDTDSIEVYRAEGAGSVQGSSTLIAVVSGGLTTYSDPISVATDTFYNYWLRTRRDSYRASNNSNVRTYSSYTSTIAGKVLASTSTTIYSVMVSAPVIFKDAPDAATSGTHTNITVSGRKIIGNTITSPFGFVTITGNGLTEASPAPFSTITTSISPDAGRSFYTARLYDSSPKTNLLDSQDIPVVFKGASGTSGTNSIYIAYTNTSLNVPVDNSGVETWTGSGGLLYVYDGTTLLTLASNTQSTSYPASNSQYNLDIVQVSGNTLSEPGITGSGTTTATLGSSVTWGGDLTTITVYRITAYIRTSTGATVTRSVDVTIAPANQGVNAVVAVLSKDSHVFPAAADGTVTNYTGANTEIRVYDGATLLTYSPPAANNGKWTVSSAVGSNITVPSATDSGTFATYTYTAGVTQPTDTSTATFTITGKTTGGSSFTLTKVQAFTKAKTGTTGSPGTAGSSGSPATYITISRSSALVTAYADGTVKTGEFPLLGTLKVYNGATDVTASSTLSSTTSGCVGLVSPDGTYRITAFSPTTVDSGILTLSAQYPQGTGPSYTAAFSVSKNKIGYEIVADITALNALTQLFDGRMAYVQSSGKLYRYVGTPGSGGAWSSAVSGTDIAPTTLPSTAFASDIQPVKIWTTSPATHPSSPGVIGGALTLFNQTNGKLYRWVSPSYVASVPTVDLAGQVVGDQIADLAVSLNKFADGLKPVERLGSLPTQPQPVGRMVFLTTDNKLYRSTGTTWTTSVNGADIETNTIDINKFTTDIQPVKIVSSVNPVTTYLGANIVFNSSDGKLYRWDTTLNPDAYTVNVPSGDLFGQIVSGQISDNAITGSKLAVGDFSVLNRNWNFEEGDTQWTKGGGWTVNNTSGQQKSGSWAAVKTTTGATSITNTQTTPTESGETFYAEAYIKHAAGNAGGTGVAVRILAYQSDGTTLTGTFAGNYVTTSSTTYTKSFISAAMPANTAFVVVDVRSVGTMTTNNGIYVDEVRLFRTSNTTLIADGAITTDKITVNSLNADRLLAGTISAAKIGASQISTQKLLVAPVSLCPDPYFADESWWTAYQFDANGWYFESNPTFMNVSKQVALWSGAAVPPGSTRKHVWTDVVPAPAIGSNVRLRARIKNTSNHNIYVTARFYDVSDVSAGDITLDSAPNSGTQDLTVQGTVPSNAAKVRFIIYNLAGTTFTGSAAVSAVMFDIAASADLIVDGAVIATKVAAGAITAEKITVSSIGDSSILNPGFEEASSSDPTLPSHWNRGLVWGGTSTTSYRDTTVSLSGTATLALNPGAGASADMSSDSIPVVPGDKWVLSFQAKASGTTGGPGFYARLRCGTTSTDVTTSELYAGIENAVVPTTWTKYSVNFDIPAGVSWARPIFLNYLTNTGAKINIDDVAFRKVIGATSIADGAINTDKIAANAITAGKILAGEITTSKIAANAITASKLTLRSNDDLFPDPGFYDFTWWGFGTDANYSGQGGSPVSTAPARILRVTGGMASARDYSTPSIPIEVGATYRVKLRIFISTDAAGWIATNIHLPWQDWYTPAPRNYRADVDASAYPVIDMSTTTITKGSWQTYTGTFTFAANATGAITQFRNRALLTAGYVDFCWEVVRASNAELIVDGSIVADKIAAGSITTSKLVVADMSRVFSDVFDSATSISEWTNWNGSGELSIVSDASSRFGGKALQVGNNSGDDQAWLIHNRNIPFDENTTYRIRARIRETLGTGTVFVGWAGVAADGTTFVNINGSNSYTGQHYHAAYGSNPVSTYTEYVGYTRGYGASVGTGTAGTNSTPGQMHPNVRYIRPLVLVNYANLAGTVFIDAVTVDVVADANLIVDGSITTNKMTAGSIDADRLVAGSITSGLISANAITASKLAIADFSVLNRNWNFEEGDTQWAKTTGWTIETSPTVAKTGSYIAKKTGTAANAIVNDQKVSTEANETFYAEAYIRHASGNSPTGANSGAAVRCVITDAGGTLITGGSLTGTWVSPSITTYTKSTLSFTIPSPATGNRPALVDVRIVSQNMAINNGIYIDEVRLFRTSNSTLIADGAITTAKVSAGAITANEIFAGTITAAEIASNTITGDKLTVNSISSRELAISTTSPAAPSATGIFMDGSANSPRIDIYDSGILRVRIGRLS